MSENYRQEIQQLLELCADIGCEAYLEEPMKRHTWFRIGGAADIFLSPANQTQLQMLMDECITSRLPLTVIGNGSNLLVSDRGIRGAVLCVGNSFSGVELAGRDEQGRILLDAKAGTTLSRLCTFAQEQGLTGMEFAYGIPGNVGGAVYMNAGAYGGEMKDVVVSATHLERKGLVTLDRESLDFSYRHSWYTDRRECCIVGARIALEPGDPVQIRAKMEELLARRREKQPLEYPSAGSTFKRPAGNYAAALIDQCGLKGKRIGGAMVSEKHAGFLINYDNATCQDVLDLIALVQKTVYEQTGYKLECELKKIGD